MRSLAIAGDQSAMLLALRALLSMAEFFGIDAAGQERIAAAYRSFSEGFGTPDLKAAAGVLARHGVEA